MTFNELIDSLLQLREELATATGRDDPEDAGDVTAFIAYQPSWPLQSGIDTVTLMHPGRGGGRDVEANEAVVYVAGGCGSGNAYAPSEAWDGGYLYHTADDEEAA